MIKYYFSFIWLKWHIWDNILKIARNVPNLEIFQILCNIINHFNQVGKYRMKSFTELKYLGHYIKKKMRGWPNCDFDL